ncbi:family 43 glycosylhydrolase [Dysgonomonas sp. Marseille-P4677]|uniref:glycoside hydrolase family 43 protein n=1 Tax=Dysgonomonas sp. Marseille-P4677 TaxID=2364790 RepID=UPI00191181D2|nr:glycoside hydrolase family 43 protein [Dysgonomonas sp. Marseille-P4677]MBK5721847.1 family 43 glycosylhydrolase [Dysgonomonas sp. Marseille-P4677]
MYKLILFFLFLSASLCAQNVEQTYRNPVIACDLPDPSVIRVGEDYYAAGTTSEFAPNYPLYHSRDLVNWERIGAVFNNPPEWIVGDCWAPELYYNDGTYFAYYTARRKSDNISCIGVATTTDIRKGFTDHGIIIEWGKEAIDAYVFKDDDGKLYITWKAYGLDKRPIEILASELSADGLSLKGEHFTLSDPAKGWIERGDEGQCIVKRNGYYYHFYSVGGCCDNRCDYRVHVARAKSLLGEWEQYEPKPILQGGTAWRCSGHGTLVQSPEGRYFYLYHAYNAHDFEYVGRQALLDELMWDDNTGWPYFRYGDTPTAQAPVPFAGTVQKRNIDIRDNFKTPKYNTYWQWDMYTSKPNVTKDSKGITIVNEKSGLSFWGVNSQSGNYTMSTEIIGKGSNFKGLTVYGSAKSLYAWGVEGAKIKLFKIQDNKKEEVYSEAISGDSASVHIKIEAVSGRLFRFLWSSDNTEWNIYPKDNKSIDAAFLPQWGRGLRVGFLIENNGSDNNATFSYFDLINKF